MKKSIETQKKKSPLDAEKGALLTGPGGMDDAGPWPGIFELCLEPVFSGQTPTAPE